MGSAQVQHCVTQCRWLLPPESNLQPQPFCTPTKTSKSACPADQANSGATPHLDALPLDLALERPPHGAVEPALACGEARRVEATWVYTSLGENARQDQQCKPPAEALCKAAQPTRLVQTPARAALQRQARTRHHEATGVRAVRRGHPLHREGGAAAHQLWQTAATTGTSRQLPASQRWCQQPGPDHEAGHHPATLPNQFPPRCACPPARGWRSSWQRGLPLTCSAPAA